MQPNPVESTRDLMVTGKVSAVRYMYIWRRLWKKVLYIYYISSRQEFNFIASGEVRN